MSNVEVEIEGPAGNTLTIEGRTEIPLDPEAPTTFHIKIVSSTDAEGREIPVTSEDLDHVAERGPAAIAAKEEALIDRFLAALD